MSHWLFQNNKNLVGRASLPAILVHQTTEGGMRCAFPPYTHFEL